MLKVYIVFLSTTVLSVVYAQNEDWRSCDGVKCAAEHVCIMRELTCLEKNCPKIAAVPICVPNNQGDNSPEGNIVQRRSGGYSTYRRDNDRDTDRGTDRDFRENAKDIRELTRTVAEESDDIDTLQTRIDCYRYPTAPGCARDVVEVPVPVADYPYPYYQQPNACYDRICVSGYFCDVATDGNPYCYPNGSYYRRQANRRPSQPEGKQKK